MAYKLKLDKDGHAVLQEGKPVYIKDDGDEMAFDANLAFNKHHQLNEENKDWRLKLEEANKTLKQFEKIDPAKYNEYAEIAGKFKESEMAKNGELEKLKQELAQTSEKKIKEVEETWQARYQAKAEEAAKFSQQYNKTVIGNKFLNSKYINDNLVVPADVIEKMFGERFSIDPDTNTVIALDGAGKPMLSEDKIGHVADFDEAVKLMMKQYPHREKLMKPSGVPGGGMGNNGRGMASDHDFYADKTIDATTKLNKIRQSGRN